MELWQLALYGAVGFVMSIVSGVAGVGVGFVTTPLAIFLGLSPAHAVSTGKLNGLAVSIGSLSGMGKARGVVRWRRIIPVMVLALLVGLVTPFIIKSLDSGVYRMALGIILLLMIPVIILKKVGLKPRQPKTWQRIIGSGLLSVSLLLQGVFSGGMGSLVNIVLMGMFGMTAIEANVTKRWSQMVLNTTIVLSVIGSGLIVWQVGLVGAATTLVGSYIGGRMAVDRGNGFIMHVMVALMLVSGVALLVGT